MEAKVETVVRTLLATMPENNKKEQEMYVAYLLECPEKQGYRIDLTTESNDLVAYSFLAQELPEAVQLYYAVTQRLMTDFNYLILVPRN